MTFVKNTFPQDKLITILKSCPLFRVIPNEGLVLLLENCGYIQFETGRILHHEGELFKYCPLVIGGQIEVFRNSYLGNEKVFGIFQAGEIVAIAAAFMPHNRYPMTLRAREKGEALLLEKKDILLLCQRYPVIMEKLLVRFSLKLYENINHIDWLTSSSAEQRLAAYLLELTKQQQTENVLLPLSRGQLAAKLGIRYETLSRILSSWRQKEGINIKKGRIQIKNGDYLAQLAISAQRPF
ncbi:MULTISPECIES: Crp/Fnr family transcriptional regulator [Xenorhabdus]|uniref:Crp/Fnr family transcriptional regulator n=1 Tax=Xenorhabdus TaxID=626 RepID=UPI0006456AD6|nr:MULTISPECIES: Crp/Fnr family transcriptional regulator [Xenorhabdus]MBC8945688.1 fumarate/nitrate reduction transcriptional regulator [Xenorhabdus indica]